MNTKYNKYDVCQVRVTRNNITDIHIDTPSEHDVDVDNIDPITNKYRKKSEHEFDYIMNIGDTLEIPVSLTVQDSSFGPSNYLKWEFTEDAVNSSSEGYRILELSDGTPNHSNAWNEEFDWTNTSPNTVNTNKLRPVLTVKAIGIGDAEFHAVAYDNTSDKTKIYASEELITELTNDLGFAPLTSKNDYLLEVGVNLRWYTTDKNILKGIVKQYEEYRETVSDNVKGENGNCYITIDGVKYLLIENNIRVNINDYINVDYLETHGVPIEGASIRLTPDKKLYITIPETCEIKNLVTTPEGIPVSFTFKPEIVTLEDGTITSYISVNVIDPSGEVLLNRIGTMPVYLNASANLPHLIKDGFFEGIYVGTDSVRKTWMSFGEIKKYDDSDNLANYMSCRLTFPRDIEALSELPTKEINAPYTYPGTGNYLKDENGEYQYVKSRNVRIRVVGTPKKLEIGWCNIWNEDNGKLPPLQKIDSDTTTMERSSERKHRYMMIGFDDDFNYLLDEAENSSIDETGFDVGYKLEEKYKSFAWFSDNENVVKFKDVEYVVSCNENGKYDSSLAYRDKNGELTNNINEVEYTDEFGNHIKGSKLNNPNYNRTFKVRSSRIKEVICEEKGIANVYIVSPKGQAVRRLKVIID